MEVEADRVGNPQDALGSGMGEAQSRNDAEAGQALVLKVSR